MDDILKSLTNRVLIAIFVEGTKHSQKPGRFVTNGYGYYQSKPGVLGEFVSDGIVSHDFQFYDLIYTSPTRESWLSQFEEKWKTEVQPELAKYKDYKYLNVELFVKTYEKDGSAKGEIVTVYARDILYVPPVVDNNNRTTSIATRKRPLSLAEQLLKEKKGSQVLVRRAEATEKSVASTSKTWIEKPVAKKPLPTSQVKPSGKLVWRGPAKAAIASRFK